MSALKVVRSASVFMLPGLPVRYTAYYPAGQTEKVLSMQPDGSFQTRAADAIGPWETAERIGDTLVYTSGDDSWAVLIR